MKGSEIVVNTFNYNETLQKLMTPEIMDGLTAVYEYKGRDALYQELRSAELEKLKEIALIQSTESSNRIEGISTNNTRLREILQNKTTPKNRDEREIAGYKKVLDLIHENYEGIDIRPNIILQLHRDLYSAQELSMGGHWKDSDNVIMERHADGEFRVRFKPTPAVATPGAMDSLCGEYNSVIRSRSFDSLLTSLVFVFDFVSIHPFSDGNGRMSRLLILLLLYKCGFNVGKYISIEKCIEDNKSAYYDALADSSYGWENGSNTYKPFVNYMLGIILMCYRELDDRMKLLDKPESSEAAVRRYFERHLGKKSKQEIAEGCPELSTRTIERVLNQMVEKGLLEKTGAARSTAYIYRGWDK